MLEFIADFMQWYDNLTGYQQFYATLGFLFILIVIWEFVGDAISDYKFNAVKTAQAKEPPAPRAANELMMPAEANEHYREAHKRAVGYYPE